MQTPDTSSTILYADPDHSGIRLGVLFSMVVAYILGFFLVRLLIVWLAPNSTLADFATIVSCIGALPISLACAFLVERFLKGTWHSGMKIELNPSELRYEDTTADYFDPLIVSWGQRVNLTRWYFPVAGYAKAGRERLVSDSSLCLACQMHQDDTRLIVYTYAEADQAQQWLEGNSLSEPFHEISLAKLYKAANKHRWGAATRPEIPSEMLAGVDGRFWIAERRRWSEGLELSPEDFADFMGYVEKNLAAQDINS